MKFSLLYSINYYNETCKLKSVPKNIQQLKHRKVVIKLVENARTI